MEWLKKNGVTIALIAGTIVVLYFAYQWWQQNQATNAANAQSQSVSDAEAQANEYTALQNLTSNSGTSSGSTGTSVYSDSPNTSANTTTTTATPTTVAETPATTATSTAATQPTTPAWGQPDYNLASLNTPLPGDTGYTGSIVLQQATASQPPGAFQPASSQPETTSPVTPVTVMLGSGTGNLGLQTKSRNSTQSIAASY